MKSIQCNHFSEERLSVAVSYGHREVWITGYVDEVVIGCGGDGGLPKAPPVRPGGNARHSQSYGREDMVFDPIHYFRC